MLCRKIQGLFRIISHEIRAANGRPCVFSGPVRAEKPPSPRREKPPLERRCPSAHTGAEDCILAKPKYTKYTRFLQILFTSYVRLRRTQSSASLRLTAPFQRSLFGANLWLHSLLQIARAAWTPEAPAWARPLVTPAPSPAAKKLGRAVSSSPVSWRRA